MQNVVKECKPVLRASVDADVAELANHLREEDVLELAHSSGHTPLEAVRQGFEISNEVLTVTLAGRVVMMVGVTGKPGYAGSPWMLATDDLKKIRKSFLRQGGAVQQRWLREYKHLENKVWTKNTTHVQWLKWLGYTFDAPAVHGVSGELFQRFYMKEENV